MRDEVSAKYGLSSKVKNSLVADGCIIDGEIENCILFRGVNVKKGARLSNCIIMQNSTIESNASLSYVCRAGGAISRRDASSPDLRAIPS